MKTIVVAGSLNMDLSVRTPRIPAAGETILGGDLLESPGGKGANQAYAAAKLTSGAMVSVLGCVGHDEFGREMLRNLARAGCEVSHVETVSGPSGVALIVVSSQGENAIVVAPGANAIFTEEIARKLIPALDGADSLLLQLEIPLPTVVSLAQAARARNVRVILDPAPAPDLGLPAELYSLTGILTPNENEAAALTATKVRTITGDIAAQMAEQLAGRGCRSVILKLGARGCLLWHDDKPTFIPAPRVEAIDTTAAGDVFNAALAVALSEGLALPDACWFANRAAALSVTRKGAQLSAPSRQELESFLATN